MHLDFVRLFTITPDRVTVVPLGARRHSSPRVGDRLEPVPQASAMPKSMPDPPSKVLRREKTSVTGAEMTVEEALDGLRTLYLDKHTQSEIRVVGKDEGKEIFDKVEPLELVQIMSVVTLGWLDGNTAPKVLLIGVGGGSMANVLLAGFPAEARLHLVELEPEVLQAAVDFFGVPMSIDPRCTGEAADGAAIMREHAAKCRTARATGDSPPGYDVLILDAFTKDGLAESTRQKATLDDAAACLADGGLLVVNLHTGDADDPDYIVAKAILRSLAVRFEAVYSALCSTTLNLIALCHQGDFLDADEWESKLSKVLARPEISSRCNLDLSRTLERLDFVGGKEHKVMKNVGLWR